MSGGSLILRLLFVVGMVAVAGCPRLVAPTPPDAGPGDSAPEPLLITGMEVEEDRSYLGGGLAPDGGAVDLLAYAGDTLRVTGSGWIANAASLRVGTTVLDLVEASDTVLRGRLKVDTPLATVRVVQAERSSQPTAARVAVLGPGSPAAVVVTSTLEPTVTITAAGTASLPCQDVVLRDGGVGGYVNTADCQALNSPAGVLAVTFSLGAAPSVVADSYVGYVPLLGPTPPVETVPAPVGGEARLVQAVKPFEYPQEAVRTAVQDTVFREAGASSRVLVGGRVVVEGPELGPWLLRIANETFAAVERLGPGGDEHRIRRFSPAGDGGPGGWLMEAAGPDGGVLAGRAVAAGAMIAGWDPGVNTAAPEVLTLACLPRPDDAFNLAVHRTFLADGFQVQVSSTRHAPELTGPPGQQQPACDADCEAYNQCEICQFLASCTETQSCGAALVPLMQGTRACLGDVACRAKVNSATECLGLDTCTDQLLCDPPGGCGCAQDTACAAALPCAQDPMCEPAVHCLSNGTCNFLLLLGGVVACSAGTGAAGCVDSAMQARDCLVDADCRASFECAVTPGCACQISATDGGADPLCCGSSPGCVELLTCLGDPACAQTASCALTPGCSELANPAIDLCRGNPALCAAAARCARDPQCRANARCQQDPDQCVLDAECRAQMCTTERTVSLTPVVPGAFVLTPQVAFDPFASREGLPLCALDLYSEDLHGLDDGLDMSTAAVVPADAEGNGGRIMVIPSAFEAPQQQIVSIGFDGTVGLVHTRRAYQALVSDSQYGFLYAVPARGGRVDVLSLDGTLASSAHVLGAPRDAWPLDAADGSVLLVMSSGVLTVNASGEPLRRAFFSLPSPLALEGVPGQDPQVLWMAGIKRAAGRLQMMRVDLSANEETFGAQEVQPVATGGLGVEQLEDVSVVAADNGLLLLQLQGMGGAPAPNPPCATQPDGAPIWLALVDANDVSGLALEMLEGSCGAGFAAFNPWSHTAYLNRVTDDGAVTLLTVDLSAETPTATVASVGTLAVALTAVPGGGMLGVFYHGDFEFGGITADGTYRPALLDALPFVSPVMAVSPDVRRLYAAEEGLLVELTLDVPATDPDQCLRPGICPAVHRLVSIEGRPDAIRMSRSGDTLLLINGGAQTVQVVR